MHIGLKRHKGTLHQLELNTPRLRIGYLSIIPTYLPYEYLSTLRPFTTRFIQKSELARGVTVLLGAFRKSTDLRQ